MGRPEFDSRQELVALVEFPKIFILISYNPQGGLSEKSLGFRDEWDKAFTNFLRELRQKAEKVGKGVIWAPPKKFPPPFTPPKAVSISSYAFLSCSGHPAGKVPCGIL